MRTLYTLLFLLAATTLAAVTVSAQTDFWVTTGGPTGGNVTRIAADSNGALYALADNGIYRSTNNGASWSRSNDASTGVTFISFAIARNDDYFASSANGGVYRSSDEGLSWEAVNEGIPQSFAWSIAANPVADEVLVATGPGVYRTTDNGASWSITGNERIGRPVLFAPDGTAFIAVDSGVMVSTDPARATWTWTGGDSSIAPSIITSMIMVGDDTLWAGTEEHGLFVSGDRGATWTARSTGLTSMQISAIDPGFAGEVFVATLDGALHRSTDGGALWVNTNPGVTQFIASSILRAPTTRMFVTSPKGMFYTDVHAVGVPWEPSRTGIINSVIRTVIPTTNDRVYAVQYTGTFHRKGGTENEWSISDLNIPPNTDVTAMSMDSLGSLYVAVRGAGLYRSDNEGATWEAFAPTLPTTMPTALAIDKLGRLYVGSQDGKVHRSSDNGATWESNTLGSASITSILLAGTTIYVGSEQNVFVSQDRGDSYTPSTTTVRTYSLAAGPNGEVYAGSFVGRVYRSYDQGATWEYTTTSPVAPIVSALAVNALGHVYAGAQPGGIFVSRDRGVTWKPEQSGLVNPAITTLAFDREGTAWVGTYGGGVQRSSEPTTGIEPERTLEGVTVAVTPTPATADAVVTLTIDRPRFASLDLYDARGMHVATLGGGALAAGVHRFSVGDRAAGTYRAVVVIDGVAMQAPVVIVR